MSRTAEIKAEIIARREAAAVRVRKLRPAAVVAAPLTEPAVQIVEVADASGGPKPKAKKAGGKKK